jgi:hypothetical protein
VAGDQAICTRRVICPAPSSRSSRRQQTDHLALVARSPHIDRPHGDGVLTRRLTVQRPACHLNDAMLSSSFCHGRPFWTLWSWQLSKAGPTMCSDNAQVRQCPSRILWSSLCVFSFCGDSRSRLNHCSWSGELSLRTGRPVERITRGGIQEDGSVTGCRVLWVPVVCHPHRRWQLL